MTDMEGKPLDFSHGSKLVKNTGGNSEKVGLLLNFGLLNINDDSADVGEFHIAYSIYIVFGRRGCVWRARAPQTFACCHCLLHCLHPGQIVEFPHPPHFRVWKGGLSSSEKVAPHSNRCNTNQTPSLTTSMAHVLLAFSFHQGPQPKTRNLRVCGMHNPGAEQEPMLSHRSFLRSGWPCAWNSIN